MIHFPDAQRELRSRIAVGGGVEPGAEDDVLRDARAPGGRELVLGKPAARREEGAHVGRDAAFLELRRIGAERRRRLGTENPDRDGIDEDGRPVHQLVRGAAQRHAPRGSTGLRWNHVGSCGRRREAGARSMNGTPASGLRPPA